MKNIATVGAKHVCPRHGSGSVVSGTSKLSANGKPVACVGDKISCGATIVTGSSTLSIDGRAVAHLGSKTSHGGTIIEGDGILTVM